MLQSLDYYSGKEYLELEYKHSNFNRDFLFGLIEFFHRHKWVILFEGGMCFINSSPSGAMVY